MSIEAIKKLIEKLEKMTALWVAQWDFAVFIRESDSRLSPMYEVQRACISHVWDEPCLMLEKWEYMWTSSRERDEDAINLIK